MKDIIIPFHLPHCDHEEPSTTMVMVLANLNREWDTRVATRMETKAAKKLMPPHLKKTPQIVSDGLDNLDDAKPLV